MSDHPEDIKFKLKNIVTALRDAITVWHDLGLQLGLPESILKQIGSNPDIEGHLRIMLSKWLDYDPQASWDKLENALKAIQKNAIATNIRSKYVGAVSSQAISKDSPAPDQDDSNVAPSNIREENSRLKQELNKIQGELQVSNQQLKEKEERILQLEQSMVQMTETMETVEKEFENWKLNKEQILKEKDQVIKKKEKQIESVTNERLKACEKAMTKLEVKCFEAEKQLKQRQHHLESLHPEQPLDELLWNIEEMKAPCEMNDLHDAITSDGPMVYMRQSNKIYAYNTFTQEWSHLPDCRLIDCALVVIKHLLTTVGGNITNKLFSLAVKDKIWNEQFPPMRTQRRRTTALCTETALVVAGGMNEKLELLMTVEVMSTGLHEWSTAASLPRLLGYQSMAVCGDHVYMLGGVDRSFIPTNSVYTCSLNALISSGRKSLGARLRSLSSKNKPPTMIWSSVADLPTKRCTCVSFRGRLLVIGGEISPDEPSTVVYEYNPITNYWKTNSHVTIPRYKCYAVATSENRVLVIGGTKSCAMNMEISSS